MAKTHSTPKTRKKNASPEPKHSLHWLVAAALLMLAAFGLYRETLGFGYVLDDDVVYLQNRYVQAGYDGMGDIVSHGFIHGFNGTNDQSYRPVVLINFALEREWFNNNPQTQHAIGVFLYGLCALLVFFVSRRLFRDANPYVPLIIALLFVVHPIHTEVVANIKGRDDILHFLFAIGSVFLSLRFVDNPRNYLNLAGAALLYLLALLSKEMAITFLAIVPLTLYTFTKASAKTIGIATAPLVGMWALYLLIRSSVLSQFTFEDEEMHIINNTLAAASGFEEHFATVCVIVATYVQKLFIPHPLSWDYSYSTIPVVGFTDWQFLVSIVVLLALGSFAIWGLLKRSPIAFGILFFFITISVVSNLFLLIGATFAERFLFTPSFGFSVAIVVLLAKLTKTDLAAKDLIKKPVIVAPVAAIMLLFGYKTIAQAAVWENSETLFEAGVEATPNSSRAWASLGSHYRMQAEQTPDPNQQVRLYQMALPNYNESLAILDANFDAWYNKGLCQHRLGALKQDPKLTEAALASYTRCTEIAPQFANAWNNIGSILFDQGNLDSARTSFEKAIEQAPNHPDALTNLGATYHNSGDLQTAVEYYEKALKANPANRNAAKNAAIAYSRLGNKEKAAFYNKVAQGQ